MKLVLALLAAILSFLAWPWQPATRDAAAIQARVKRLQSFAISSAMSVPVSRYRLLLEDSERVRHRL